VLLVCLNLNNSFSSKFDNLLETVRKKRVNRNFPIIIIKIIISKMSIGVPIKLLHEAENHVVTVELKSGELYRGYLMEAEDTMNMRLDDVFVTKRDGK